jgi:hypothetical protein
MVITHCIVSNSLVGALTRKCPKQLPSIPNDLALSDLKFGSVHQSRGSRKLIFSSKALLLKHRCYVMKQLIKIGSL